MTGFRNRLSSILGRAIALPSHTRGGSRMRESRPYGSVRGARDETRVPTATRRTAIGWSLAARAVLNPTKPMLGWRVPAIGEADEAAGADAGTSGAGQNRAPKSTALRDQGAHHSPSILSTKRRMRFATG